MVLGQRSKTRKTEQNRAHKAIQDALSALQVPQEVQKIEPYAGGLVLGQTGPESPSVAGNSPLPTGDLTEATFNTALQKLIAGSGGKISITSGKRDTKRQAELWEQALKKYGSEAAARKWVAPPTGYKLSDGSIAVGSRHERGLAADLKYADEQTRKWAHEVAKQYGLHFPLSNENWHIEPLGSR